MRLALESRGYSVREAESGQLGLQEAAFHRPDVVLLDLGLPDQDGVEVLQRLREWSDVPVLVLSVRDQENVKVKAFENIHVYEFMCAVLGLRPAKNDGDPAVTRDMLR